MHISAYHPLLGRAGSLLAGRCDTTFAEYYFGFRQVPFCFIKSALALHHSGSGALPELFHHSCCNFGHLSDIRSNMNRYACVASTAAVGSASAAVSEAGPLRAAAPVSPTMRLSCMICAAY